jgi:hypothetical protein
VGSDEKKNIVKNLKQVHISFKLRRSPVRRYAIQLAGQKYKQANTNLNIVLPVAPYG